MARSGKARPPLLAVALAALAAFLLAACGGQEEAKAPTSSPTPSPRATATATTANPASLRYPVTVQDSDGRAITIAAKPQKVVTLAPSLTESVFALGAGDAVVATDRFSDFPAAARGREKLEYTNPSLERLVGFQPDLVLVVTRQKTLIAEMERLGLRVLLLAEPGSIEGVYGNLRTLGTALGRPEEAERVIGAMQARIKAISEKLAPVSTGPRVFYELTPDLYTAAHNTFIGEMFRLLRAQNVAEGAPVAYPQLTLEALAAKNPEVIILADGKEYGTGNESPETVKARPGWAEMAAVKANRIYVIDPKLISVPGPRLVEGLEAMARVLYPEIFR